MNGARVRKPWLPLFIHEDPNSMEDNGYRRQQRSLPQPIPGCGTETEEEEDPIGRRKWILSSSSIFGTVASLLLRDGAIAVEPLPADSQSLPGGLLEARLTENLMSSPPYGIESADVFYPPYFKGVWEVTSTTTSVEAPCGIFLFGGNATFQSSLKEIGPENALRYKARFVSIDNNSKCIADRDFNVREIASAAMGNFSVLDVPLATPNKFSCVIAPQGSNQLFSVDLISLARRQETMNETNFHCSEVVRQIVSPRGKEQQQQQQARSPLLKEVETISLYEFIQPNEIRCVQRSATFLLPSQTDPMALKMWEMARGRPIDVRFYDVTYTKKG